MRAPIRTTLALQLLGLGTVACGGTDSAPGPSEPFDRPPVFDTPGTLAVPHNAPFQATIVATDPDGVPVNLTVLEKPDWVGFDAGTAALSGTPGIEHVGAHPVRIEASDGTLSSRLDLVIEVGNRRPAFGPVVVRTTEYDSLYQFPVTAFDPDEDPITVTAERIPVWADWDAATGLVSGLPGWDHVGTTHGVLFRATDGVDTNVLSFEVEVVRPTLRCDGSWTTGWPQVCHDGRVVSTDRFLVFSEASSPDARRSAAEAAETAQADAMVKTETTWTDFDFHPSYSEPKIHLMLDYGQMNSSGLAYAHGAIMRATDSPRFFQFYTPERWRRVLQHELTHVIEFLLIGNPQYWSVHHVWLREGFASWGARIHTVQSVDQLNAWRAQMEGLEGGGNPIGIRRFSDMPLSVRQAQNTVSYYPFFELATRYLLDPAGHGTSLDDLKGMFEAIEDGVPWDTAFENAFGITRAWFEENYWDLMEAYLGQ